MDTSTIEGLLGGYKVLGHEIHSEMDLYEIGKEGLPKMALVNLAKSINISIRSLSRILNVTERTLQRKKDLDLLNGSVSEQIIQIAEVYSRGEDVFDNIDNFQIWLDTPSTPFGKKKPFELLSSRYGAQMVLDELGRIEYGVFS